MNYSKFKLLLQGGEKANVDFKIQCDAFASRKLAPKAELAKGICAMANNGNMASYIVIGVSNDRMHCKSVSNPNLNDDNLQDFCKKAIFPPPKIKVHRELWKRVPSAHSGKEFVIIQVGPQPRQVFRLARDFIDYKEHLCYRRNEVWIRRNATTDLATPEEIVRLASGQPLQSDDQTQADREAFSRMSQSEQRAQVSAETDRSLQSLGYAKLPKRDWFKEPTFGGGGTYFKTLWKKARSTAIIVCPWPCVISLTLKDMERLAWIEFLDRYFVLWDQVPNTISALTRRSIKAVRRICVVLVLRSVPKSRIAQAFPTLRKAGSFLHYYRPELKEYRHRRDEPVVIPSSSEILILDRIKSIPDFAETLSTAIDKVEHETSTIVVPGE